MTRAVRVIVHIGRLVVHGTRDFEVEDFRDRLREEIAGQLARGASAGEIARQVRAGHVSPAPRPSGNAIAGGAPEQTAASVLAGRLLR
ncbi:hypothetical protein LMG23992_01482 [Cupriavidus laharis]|uniref:Uncharacterized protein n=1 Tax=Cupriavidus laharis TaxID=151654 RepID=A0ABN7YDQ6_9BURK|nr:hypothetical protein [Cupriavidus laharis]CAG9170145.1 hypothetical protein LMG23992_01482 [Cupriavidus laharis]